MLLLDEADSFLRSRRMAERSYEVTEVNEMLQGMERFDGIFICTTNLFEELDEAALAPLHVQDQVSCRCKPEQRLRMFVTEALERRRRPCLTDEQRAHAWQQPRIVLAPGDFAAVKRQVDVLGVPMEAG